MTYALIPIQGTTFSFNSQTIGGVTGVTNFGGGSATEIPASTMASTVKEFAMGLPDFGTFTLNINWNQDDAGQAACLTAYNAQASHSFVLTLPTSTANVGTVTAYVQSMKMDGNADDAARGSITFRTTSAVAWT